MKPRKGSKDQKAPSSRRSRQPPASQSPEAAASREPLLYPQTFFGLPRHDVDRAPSVDVLLTGLPFDGGVLYRPGARLAPNAVRAATLGFGSYSDALGISVWDEIRAADGGDVALGAYESEAALEAIARRAEAVARSGVIGGYVGGDQTVSLGVLRGLHRAKLKSVGLLHIDSCTDTAGPVGSRDLHQFSVFRRAADEGLLRPEWVLQVGIRGPHLSDQDLEFSHGKGFEIVKVDDAKWDIHSAVSQIRKIVRKGSLYVSVDVSALDPAFAPGAGATRPGGMNSWELQQLIRALVGAQIVGFDVVEVSPPYDPGGLTALAGASVLHELLAVIADTHRSARPAPSSAGRRRGKRMSP
jgi:guanidinobutyrase / D-arginase